MVNGDFLKFILGHIEAIPCIGDIFDESGHLNAAFERFIAPFGEVNSIEIVQFGELTRHLENIPPEIFHYFSLQGENVYHHENFKELKRKYLIQRITVTCHAKPLFSAINHSDRQMLRKFYIPCTIRGPNEVYSYPVELNEFWDHLQDADSIELKGALEPSVFRAFKV